MTMSSIIAVAFVVLLAGCAEGAPNGLHQDAVAGLAPGPDAVSNQTVPQAESEPPSDPAAVETNETSGDEGPVPVRIYESGGFTVVTPTGRQDSFIAPPGTVELVVTAEVRFGGWSGTLQVTHESGQVVYRQQSTLAASDGGWGGSVRGHCTCDIKVKSSAYEALEAGPGNYTVSYELAGGGLSRVRVDALVEV